LRGGARRGWVPTVVDPAIDVGGGETPPTPYAENLPHPWNELSNISKFQTLYMNQGYRDPVNILNLFNKHT